MKQKFRRMMEDQNAMRQFHIDNYTHSDRHEAFIQSLRAK